MRKPRRLTASKKLSTPIPGKLFIPICKTLSSLPPGTYAAVVLAVYLIANDTRLELKYKLDDGRIFLNSFPFDENEGLHHLCPLTTALSGLDLPTDRMDRVCVSDLVGMRCEFETETNSGKKDGRRFCNIVWIEFFPDGDDDEKTEEHNDDEDEDDMLESYFDDDDD